MHQLIVRTLAVSVLVAAAAFVRPAAAQVVATEAADQGPRFLLASASKLVPIDIRRTSVLQRRLALDLAGVTLAEALAEISARSGLRLAYSDDIVPLEPRVHLRAEAITVAAALTDVLLGAGVDVVFDPRGGASLVRRPEPVQPGSIAGRVTDAGTGEGLAAAEVYLEDTRWRALADDGGYYRLGEIEPGSYSLVVRRIGYGRRSRSVTVASGEELTLNLTLDPAPTKLQEVVVTGTVVPTEVKALPSPVTVITAEEIGALQVRRTDQLFRQIVPSALAPDMGTVTEQTAMSVRGAAALDPFEGTMKVYLDGIEITNRGVAAIDPNSIERIEVIRGPQAAAIYGSEAIGGVMQVFTKRGDSTSARPRIEAQAALGTVQSQFEGSGALRQDYRASVRGGSPAATYHAGGGYTRDGEWVPDYSLSNPSVFGGLHLAQGPLALDLSGRYYAQNYEREFDPRLAATGFFFFTSPPHERTESQEETYGARLSYAPRSWWQHSLTAGIDRFTSDSRNTRNRPGFFPGDSIRRLIVTNQRKASVAYNTAVTVPLGETVSASVTVGADHYELAHNRFFTFHALNVDGTIETTPDDPPVALRQVTTNTGYFGQVQLNLYEALFLTGGVRLEENTNFGEELGTPVSPRVGASYVRAFGGTTLKLRASYGEAIRPPGPGQKTEFRSPFGIQLANPLLAPERQVGGDGGVDLVFGRRGSLSVTYFDQTARDLILSIDREPVEDIPASQFQNVGRVKNRGVEIEGTLRLDPVQLSAQYAYTRSRVEEVGLSLATDLQVGDQVFGVPRHTAGATLTFSPFRQTTLALGATYVGKQTNFNTLAQLQCAGGTGPCPVESFREFLREYPAFLKTTLSVNHQITSAVSGFLSVDNLTNSNADEIDNVRAVQGRITMVGMRVTQ